MTFLDFRCDKCGCPILQEEEWVMLDSEKHLCKNCVLDVVNEMDNLGLIDYHMTEAERR